MMKWLKQMLLLNLLLLPPSLQGCSSLSSGRISRSKNLLAAVHFLLPRPAHSAVQLYGPL